MIVRCTWLNIRRQSCSENSDRHARIVLTNHGQSSVVQFAVTLSSHSLLADTREVNWWENHSRKISSLHIMSSLLSLRDNLGNQARQKDLCFSSIGNGGPLIDRLHGGKRLEGNILAQHTGKVYSRGLNKVPNCCNHSGSSVFELASLKPTESFLTSKVGQAKRIE